MIKKITNKKKKKDIKVKLKESSYEPLKQQIHNKYV